MTVSISRGREWKSAFAAGMKALIWGTLGPSLLYSAALFAVIIAYNLPNRPLVDILPRANGMFVVFLSGGVDVAGPLGALSAFLITWQTFRWTVRGDHRRSVMGKALALGALFGFLVPVWIALRLAIFQGTTFSGRFDSFRTFLFMTTHTVPVGILSAWILLLLIRPNLRSSRPQLNA